MGVLHCLQTVNIMFQATIVFLLARHVFSLPPPPEYPTPAPTQDYNPDIGQTNVGGYGVNKNPYCHMVEKVVFKNQCEPYTETTCWTQNQEHCEPVMYNNCTGVIETDIERVCFDVNELVCDLVEAIHYETLEETYQVQRCFTGKDRVCDTTYKIGMTTKDDYQCTNVETPNCYMEEKNCHFEPKKICELEMKTRPKKAKKYSYTKDCKEQPREICDQCEKKSLRPVCEMQQRLECIYTPKEECRDEDKQYCHKVERVELVEECDMKFDTSYL